MDWDIVLAHVMHVNMVASYSLDKLTNVVSGTMTLPNDVIGSTTIGSTTSVSSASSAPSPRHPARLT